MTPFLRLQNESQMVELVRQWVHELKPGQIVFLKGNLGAGKTTWVRHALRALGCQEHIKSPSYTIVESYELSGQLIHHFDLYRIVDPQELVYIGLESYLDHQAMIFVEWPDLGQGVLPKPDWEIELAADPQDPQARILRMFKHAE